ncbi:peptide chain release factor 2 [Petrocella sp. FN5]|uniref:peptide chain release factor 2 n=1 Tax=Petrocella sp. FN5 TaxID=3032002 RepID=UPI0023D9F350|nr:peptide chain release factor 2 [Petrocella sp. FN5]MDF1615971.1 peptide chain release factor 2 [Petrocella sp. FN5]
MIELDQIRQQLKGYESKLEELRASLDIPGAENKRQELEAQSSAQDFWNHPEESQEVLKSIKVLNNKIDDYKKILQDYEELDILIDMAEEESDEDLLNEIKELVATFINDYDAMVIATLLKGPYDNNNAIISLHAGAGGTESCDWVEMLYRMYTRWSNQKNYSLEVIDYLAGDEAGIKSITFEVGGENAYGYLKAEKGVHRLVRISPFDSSGRRHTSFASCDVIPDIEEEIDVEINSDDIRIDTFRASGAGGQHINKTDSAIRITHMPTGIVVQCQNERSQHKNKDKALQMLKIKLFEVERQKQLEKMTDIRGETKEIGWGSQIRSYVMHPYNMVKDHRTNQETGNVGAVMDGQLDDFINAYLKWMAVKTI